MVALVSDLVNETVSDWDLDLDEPVGGDTRLSEDLCFSSVEMLHLLAAIDMKLGTRLPFDRLIRTEAGYRTELTVGELAAFVSQNAGAPMPAIRAE